MSGAQDLDGEVAIVTGAAGALGRALATALAERGAHCCHLDIDPTGRETVLPNGSIYLTCDITDEAQVDEAVAAAARQLGGEPTILINNAGVVIREPIATASRESWERQFAVNATGPFLMSRRVLPAMLANEHGRLLHISSLVARTGGSSPGVAAYAAAKAALEGFSRAVAMECGGSGVTSNVIAPGWLATGMFAPKSKASDEVPVGRFGDADDVVAAAVYLTSPGAGFVTGQVLEVNGGLHLG